MRSSRLSVPAMFCGCFLAMWGCGGGGGGGWEPVAGKDPQAYSLIVPTLHQGESIAVTFRIFNNGSETIPGGFQAKLEAFEDESRTVPYAASGRS